MIDIPLKLHKGNCKGSYASINTVLLRKSYNDLKELDSEELKQGLEELNKSLLFLNSVKLNDNDPLIKHKKELRLKIAIIDAILKTRQ